MRFYRWVINWSGLSDDCTAEGDGKDTASLSAVATSGAVHRCSGIQDDLATRVGMPSSLLCRSARRVHFVGHRLEAVDKFDWKTSLFLSSLYKGVYAGESLAPNSIGGRVSAFCFLSNAAADASSMNSSRSGQQRRGEALRSLTQRQTLSFSPVIRRTVEIERKYISSI